MTGLSRILMIEIPNLSPANISVDMTGGPAIPGSFWVNNWSSKLVHFFADCHSYELSEKYDRINLWVDRKLWTKYEGPWFSRNRTMYCCSKEIFQYFCNIFCMEIFSNLIEDWMWREMKTDLKQFVWNNCNVSLKLICSQPFAIKHSCSLPSHLIVTSS